MSLKRRILLVEDCDDDAFLFARKIEAVGPFQVIVERDGDAALRFLKAVIADIASQPIAMFIDLRLPMVGGMQLLEWIRGCPEYQDTPCYVMSGALSSFERLQSSNRGANAAFVKPVNATTLAYALSGV